MNRVKQQTLLLAFLFIFQGLLVSCKKTDESVKSDLLHTEWSDDSGIWLFAFKSAKTFSLVYTVPGMPHSLRYEIPYKKEGDNLIVEDYKVTAHGKEYYLIKEFKGKVSDDCIVCDFKTPSVKTESGGMPDLSKLMLTRIVLKKKK